MNTEPDYNLKQSVNSNPIQAEIKRLSDKINHVNTNHLITTHSFKTPSAVKQNISHYEHDPDDNSYQIEEYKPKKDALDKHTYDDLQMRTPTVYTEKKDSKGMDNKQVFNVVKDQVQKDDQEMFYGKTKNT